MALAMRADAENETAVLNAAADKVLLIASRWRTHGMVAEAEAAENFSRSLKARVAESSQTSGLPATADKLDEVEEALEKMRSLRTDSQEAPEDFRLNQNCGGPPLKNRS